MKKVVQIIHALIITLTLFVSCGDMTGDLQKATDQRILSDKPRTVSFVSTNADIPAEPSSISIKGEALTLPALPSVPVRTGYYFTGWWMDEQGTGTPFTTHTLVTSDMKVYAGWNEKQFFQVAWYSQGGSEIAATLTQAGALITRPSDPTRSGYTFTGWYLEKECQTAWNFDADTIKKNTVLFAGWTAATYRVTFSHETDGGETITIPMDVTGPATTVGTLPSAPSRTGYIFDGWFTAPNGGGTAFTATTPVTQNITVYAKWNTYSYTVTFSPGEGLPSIEPSIVESPHTSVGTLPVQPIKADYTFAGWWTRADEGGDQFTASTIVRESITVHARWSKDPVYLVAFDSMDGSSVGAQSVKAGERAAEPVPPQRTGYAFGGWYSDEALSSPWDFASAVTGNIVLYARWLSHSWLVTFDGQGATTQANPGTKTVESPVTSVGTLPADPVRTGYTFGGWYTAVNGGGTAFTASTAVSADITVYAKWNSYSYTVTFNGMDATTAPSPATKTVTSPATTIDALPAAPARTGYIFGGWYTAPQGGGTAFTAASTVTGNITVYAKWNTYSRMVTFDSQGATTAANPTTKTVESPATSVGTLPADPVRTGYTFGGWYTAVNDGGTAFTASTAVNADITVYAKWNTYSYTVTFNGMDATTAPAPATKTVASPATTIDALPAAPARTGYIFGGWYTAPQGGGSAFTAASSVTGNITVYAKWNTYSRTVTFDSQGATTAANPATKTVASPATSVGTLPANPVRTGYTFGGWYTAVNGGGTAFTASTAVSADITVYAKWNTYSYTVTFNGMDATTAPAPATKTVASPATTIDALPAAPTRTGYIFGGWYTAPQGGGSAFTATSTVTGNITVYAKWNTYSRTVTFDSQGATTAANPTTKTVASPATSVGTLPANPVRTGYTFGGWYTAVNGGGTAFTASTAVSANITVYAKWNTYSYTVTFNGMDATTAPAPAAKTVASPATTIDALPTAPARTGYIFGGWYTAPQGGGSAFTAASSVTGNITVYAKWNTYSRTVTFDSQGATTAANPTTKTVASPATSVGTLPANPVRTGYTFGGWYTAVNGGGTAFTASTAVSADITVYAKWNTYSYTVTFNGMGATTNPSPISQPVTSPATTTPLPTNPVRTSYVFGGWFTGVNGTGTQFTASTTVTGSITVYAFWKIDGTDESWFSYTVTDGKASIAKSPSKSFDSPVGLVIPATIGGYPVTSLAANAFKDCTGITSVIIPSSVNSLGNYSFNNCSGLISISMPSSVNFIGTSAFQGCSALTSITFPNSLLSIGSQAFLGCTNITSITIPPVVMSIGVSAFKNCSNLRTVILNCLKPPTLYKGEFDAYPDVFDNNHFLRRFYVPSARLNAYKAAPTWSTYTSSIVGQ